MFTNNFFKSLDLPLMKKKKKESSGAVKRHNTLHGERDFTKKEVKRRNTFAGADQRRDPSGRFQRDCPSREDQPERCNTESGTVWGWREIEAEKENNFNGAVPLFSTGRRLRRRNGVRDDGTEMVSKMRFFFLTNSPFIVSIYCGLMLH